MRNNEQFQSRHAHPRNFISIFIVVFNIYFSIINLGCSLGTPKSEERDMQTMKETLIVDFPLRGTWITPNTPGSKVPSHGTSRYGESYAIDFVMINENDRMKKFYGKSFIEYMARGVSLKDCYGWGQNIYSPIDGEIIRTRNDVVERDRADFFKDYNYMLRATKEFTQKMGTFESLAGNYVLIKSSEKAYALLAHLRKGSILVTPGQQIKTNQIIGQVGHSGNSMAPHLHMQFMDSSDINEAKGIPFLFRTYEVKRNTQWEKVFGALPTTKEVIRFTD
jgi:murein DD-endopeptidase MepM/ murein hydrolase activator NlpD